MAGQITEVNGFTSTTGYFVTGATSFIVKYTAVTGNWYRLRTGINGGGVVYTGGAAAQAGSTSVTRGTVSSPLPAAGATQNIYLQESTLQTGPWADTGTSGTITNVTVPVVNTTQTFATTASDVISHTIALTTSGLGGTLQYATSSSATYNTGIITTWQASAVVNLTRGTTYYLWARRADGASFASVAGPFTIPYLATNFAVGTVTVGTNELTGGSTSDVSVSWTAQANHFYRVTRVDLTPTVIVIAQVSTSPQSLLNAETNDLPLEGVVAEYKIEVRRSVASGGDGVWADATGTNVSWTIQRIKEPTLDDTQDFDTSSASPISHTISLKLNGLGGTLQYGWNTTGTNSQASVTNWQTSPTFTNAFTRGSTYYFYARRSTDAADFDLSTAQVVPPQAVYGLRVYSTNGSKIVFDTTSLPMNLITCKLAAGTEITSQTLAAGATGAAVYVTGLTATNGSSVFIVVKGTAGGVGSTPPYTITRQAGYFTLTNNLTTTVTLSFFAGRYK